jgi:DNA (cytosine-5)-methyltransferase 1
LPSVISKRKLKIVEKGLEMPRLIKFHDYDFNKYKGEQHIYKIARNLVDYEAGKTILETFLGIETRENINQTTIFDL